MTDTALTDAILRDSLLLQQVAAGDQAQADAILRRLSGELRDLIATNTIGRAEKAKLNAMIRDADAILRAGYGDLSKVVDAEQIAEIINDRTVAHMTMAFRSTLPPAIMANVMPEGALPATAARIASLSRDVMIEGAPLSAWWGKQEEDTQFRFAQQVRQGVINGETQAAIVARVVGRAGVPGVMDVTRRNARKLVHSAVMSAANNARLETFRANSRFVKGVEWLATLDSHSCLVCGVLDGKQWALDGEPIAPNTITFRTPQAHPNCRCVLTAVTKTGYVPPTRASSEGPIANTTFETFLARQSPEFIEGTLGKGRAELFRNGGLTLRDFVSGGGRVISLAQLRAH